MDPVTKFAVDATGGSAAVVGGWLTLLQQGVGLFMLLGGAALLGLRIAIAYREWRNLKREDKK